MEVFDSKLLEHLVDLYYVQVKQCIWVDFALRLFCKTDIFLMRDISTINLFCFSHQSP